MNEVGNVDTDLTEESEGDENDDEESSESPSITPEPAQQKYTSQASTECIVNEPTSPTSSQAEKNVIIVLTLHCPTHKQLP